MSKERRGSRRRETPQFFIPLTLQEQLSQTYRNTGATPDVYGRKPATAAEVQRALTRKDL